MCFIYHPFGIGEKEHQHLHTSIWSRLCICVEQSTGTGIGKHFRSKKTYWHLKQTHAQQQRNMRCGWRSATDEQKVDAC